MTTSTSTEVEEQETLPAIFDHCKNVYARMEEEAQLVHIQGNYEGVPTIDGSELIWEGHLTKLFAALHLSVPYYTKVTRELKRMGCIRQRRRGGGNASSQWVILTEPTEELWCSDNNRTTNLASKKSSKVDMLEQQVKDLATLCQKISSDYDTIIDVLAEQEKARG